MLDGAASRKKVDGSYQMGDEDIVKCRGLRWQELAGAKTDRGKERSWM